MPIRFTCASCNSVMQVADQYAGKKVRCPKCQAVSVAPAVKPAAAPLLPIAAAIPVAAAPGTNAAAGPAMPVSPQAAVPVTPTSIQFACSECQSVVKVLREYAGKKVRCPQCKAVIIAPGAPMAAVPVPVPPQAAAPVPVHNVLPALLVPLSPETPMPVPVDAVSAQPLQARAAVPAHAPIPPEPDIRRRPRREHRDDRPLAPMPYVRSLVTALVLMAVLVFGGLLVSYLLAVNIAASQKRNGFMRFGGKAEGVPGPAIDRNSLLIET